jgi:phosphoribosylaminoimidazole-succinocarboxamide synthase
MVSSVVLETRLAGLKVFKHGKVRDIYALGEHLLMVATDRISAFDVVLPTGIPCKGAVLTALSVFWFTKVRDRFPSHLVTSDIDEMIRNHRSLESHRAVLEGRSMLVKKTGVVPIECVVRGYLSGSGWKEYRKNRSVCGVRLPPGLLESQELPEPIFTPATKEESGHDLNVTEREMARRVGQTLTRELKKVSLSLYTMARDYARSRGIIIADTKFEFGLRDGAAILIDELLTPDSSRFWPVEGYAPGRSQASFDKQFVRDYLERLPWDKTPPAPALPEEIVKKTSEKYLQALNLLAGKVPVVPL